MSYNEWLQRYISTAIAAGLTYSEADALRRDAQRIASWDLHECNGTIQWAEKGQKDHRGRTLKAGRPYWVHGQDDAKCPPGGRWTLRSDTYTPAMTRVQAVAKAHNLTVEYNGDPRGWPFRFFTTEGREIAPPVREN